MKCWGWQGCLLKVSRMKVIQDVWQRFLASGPLGQSDRVTRQASTRVGPRVCVGLSQNRRGRMFDERRLEMK